MIHKIRKVLKAMKMIFCIIIDFVLVIALRTKLIDNVIFDTQKRKVSNET